MLKEFAELNKFDLASINTNDGNTLNIIFWEITHEVRVKIVEEYFTKIINLDYYVILE